ncbi:MAG: O-antigen ligase family protein [Janthinobacterium sp.]|uniref:O-antigen ligase family protein n=1 Tax=Janthinobacterium sp. TND4EL3 TaxID=1907311 RepID=UPI0009546A94|nr:O-antigen ligase family protein [Janthinobacterium sp. TND4EL3]SIQ62272.1 O-Antigen ligase [Janthinobacterium sp. TND4EL3]
MEELIIYFLLPLGALLFALLAIGGAVFVAGIAVRWRGWAFATVFLLTVAASISSIVLSFRKLTMSEQGLMNMSDGDGASGLVSKLILMAVIGISLALCLAWLFDFNKKLRQHSRFTRRGLCAPNDIVIAFMVFFVAFSIVPIFMGQRYYFHVSLIYPFFIYLAMFLYLQVSDIDPVRISKYCLGALVFGSLAAAVVTPNAAFQPGYNGLIPGFNLRLWGVTAHANALGAVACAFFLMEMAEPEKKRWIHLGILFVAGVTMIMSQSKTSILAAFMGGTMITGMQIWNYLVAQTRGYNRNSSTFLAVLLMGFCFAVTMLGIWIMFSDVNLLTVIESKLDSRAVGDLSTGTGRLWIWSAAIKGGMENPLFGQGASFWNLENRLRMGLNGAVSAHNLYLQVFSRSGLIGLASLLAFLFFLIRYAMRASKATNGASLVMLAVLLVRSMTEVPIAPNGILGAEFFATMAYIFYIIDRGARPLPQSASIEKKRPVIFANGRFREQT